MHVHAYILFCSAQNATDTVSAQTRHGYMTSVLLSHAKLHCNVTGVEHMPMLIGDWSARFVDMGEQGCHCSLRQQ